MTDDDRLALIGGPYAAPAAAPGHVLTCSLRGRVVVRGRSQAPIPWPTHRRGAFILCGDLERAVRVESTQAVAHWFGVSPTLVSRWRRHLGVPAYNAGSRRLAQIRVPKAHSPHSRVRSSGDGNEDAVAKALATKAQRGASNYKPWRNDEDALLGTCTDREVALLLGRGLDAVGMRRRKLGIPAQHLTCRSDLASVSPERVRERRRALGMIQSQVAERSGISPTKLSLLERGHRMCLKPTTLDRLARALECEPDHLLA